MRRRLLVNLALALGVSVVFLAALEGLARLVAPAPPPPPPVADYIWDWDQKMPGGFYVMKSESVGWPPWEEFNGDGLRDRTRPREKPEGFWRVAVLGDSVTLGDGIRPYEAFPRVMEARLQGEGRRFEVMSVALWGWSTRQERTAWERIARGYHPDQALLAVCLNDIPELQNNLARPPRWLAWLHERSALVRLLVGAKRREIGNVEGLFASPPPPSVEEGFRRFFNEVGALRREVEADGATLAVAVFPFRFQVEPGAPPPVVQRRIASFCEEEKLPCVDLLPALSRAGPSAFLDYDHLSASGSVLAAETLLASGLLPPGYSNPEVLAARFGAGGDPGAAAVRSWLAERSRPLGEAGVRALVRALATGKVEERIASAWALESAGPSASAGREALVSALGGDADAGVRAAAARALGALGEAARAASPALFRALADSSETVRHDAADSLSHVEMRPDDLRPLIAALGSRDPYVRAFAEWTLGNMEATAGEAVPALAALVDDPETGVVVSAALARIGPAARAAVPALVAALRSEDSGRRWRAARTLGRIGPGAGEAVPALVAALRDPNEGVRRHAARALGRIAPATGPAAAALQRATGDPDRAVRREAEKALEDLQARAAGVAPQ
jgi:HEAT repeat protein